MAPNRYYTLQKYSTFHYSSNGVFFLYSAVLTESDNYILCDEVVQGVAFLDATFNGCCNVPHPPPMEAAVAARVAAG